MADNIEVTAGTGTVVHADEYTHATYGAGKTQLVKLALGAPGTGVEAVAGAGAVSTGVQRVTLASDDPAVVALQILDNAISGNEMQVDVLTMPTITVNSHAVTNAGTFAVQAAITAASGSIGSGAIASGAIASGAVASGAVASGAVASGAFASGALASGSIVAGAIAAGATSIAKLGDAAYANGDALVGVGGVRNDALSTLTPAEDDWAPLQLNARGAQWVEVDSTSDIAHDADASAVKPALIGGFASSAVQTAVSAANDAVKAWFTLNGVQATTPQPHTHGGLSVFRSLDLDETEEDVKTTAGCLYKIRATNRTTSARYLKLYNATAANVIVGTTVAPTLFETIVIPGGGSADLATVITENFGGIGLAFDTALSMAVTTGLADNDTGAPGANDVVVSAYYK
jgi:hypothetical protein